MPINPRTLMSFGYLLLFGGLACMGAALVWPQADGGGETVRLALLNLKTVLAACGGGLAAAGGALVGAGAIVAALQANE